MLKIYTSPMCPDCRECKVNFDHHGIAYEAVDINESLPNLKAFLRLRDGSPVFDVCRERGSIGIPALVEDDGSVTLDWESYLAGKGLPVVYKESGPACSLDGKNC